MDRVRSAVARTAREDLYESRQATGLFDSTADRVEQRMDGRRVRAALEEMSQPQRAVIELAFFDGLAHQEVSDRLDVPLGTTKTRVRDGLRKPRTLMGGAS